MMLAVPSMVGVCCSSVVHRQQYLPMLSYLFTHSIWQGRDEWKFGIRIDGIDNGSLIKFEGNMIACSRRFSKMCLTSVLLFIQKVVNAS